MRRVRPGRSKLPDPVRIGYPARLHPFMVAVVLAAGCGPGPGETVQVVSGHVVWGHEERTFRPCGTDSLLWLSDGTQGDLPSEWERLALDPYDSVYMELEAEERSAPEEGFGAGLTGELRVVRVLRVVREGRTCGWAPEPGALWASGNEPAWSLMGREGAWNLTVGIPPDTLDATAEGVTVEVADGPCYDTMSGERRPLVVTVTVGSRHLTLRGCGARGR